MIHAGTFWKVSGNTASPSTGAEFVMRTSRHRRRVVSFGVWFLWLLL